MLVDVQVTPFLPGVCYSIFTLVGEFINIGLYKCLVGYCNFWLFLSNQIGRRRCRGDQGDQLPLNLIILCLYPAFRFIFVISFNHWIRSCIPLTKNAAFSPGRDYSKITTPREGVCFTILVTIMWKMEDRDPSKRQFYPSICIH